MNIEHVEKIGRLVSIEHGDGVQDGIYGCIRDAGETFEVLTGFGMLHGVPINRAPADCHIGLAEVRGGSLYSVQPATEAQFDAACDATKLATASRAAIEKHRSVFEKLAAH